MASLDLRISFGDGRRLGPGKIALLEAIAACGSIAGAGRRLSMSYKRAWDLVEEMNHMCGAPVVASQIGGRNGGGASLTDVGEALVTRYRSIEMTLRRTAAEDLAALESHIKSATF